MEGSVTSIHNNFLQMATRVTELGHEQNNIFTLIGISLWALWQTCLSLFCHHIYLHEALT
jgi:hypothetical protein